VYIVAKDLFHKALKEQGYPSLSQLARDLGIHRNTLHYYLAGRPLLPENFERVIGALGLSPGEILVQKKSSPDIPYQEIVPLIDQLHAEFPQVTFILFGSRAKGKARRYSDWDLGVYHKDGLDHSTYRSIVKRKGNLTEDFPYLVEVVNLNRADLEFLKDISRHWIFLTGRRQDWVDLQKRVLA